MTGMRHYHSIDHSIARRCLLLVAAMIFFRNIPVSARFICGFGVLLLNFKQYTFCIDECNFSLSHIKP